MAIANDFDLSHEDQRIQLERILEDLGGQAVAEQELELAPPVRPDSAQAEENKSKSRTASSLRKTHTTGFEDATASVTTGISDLQVSSGGTDADQVEEQGVDLPQGLEGGSQTEKETWLKGLFPTIESVQINETIAKCNGDIQKSVDELLNLSFIHEDIDQNYIPHSTAKGIEAFLGEGKTKKRKPKKNGRRRQEKDDAYWSDGTLSSGAVTPNNIWRNAAEDVEFIVSRTQLPAATVKSIYHQNNANLGLTIRTLVAKEADAQASKMKTDDILQLQVDELKLEIEGVADHYIYGALLIAQMIPSAAKDLLEAMMQQPKEQTPKRLTAQYTPISLSEDEKPKKKTPTPKPPADPGLLMGEASVLSAHADRSFSQASSAFRRGRSDHLMGGAAAYYADVGHQQRKQQKQLLASAADALVIQQSTADSLDLHGVSVEHAVRIARSSVENWWETLGDRKYAIGGLGNGYKIIVGLGTHSSQGISRIGPAVTKMLIREGWKVNIQRGAVVVEGKSRH